MGKASHEHDFFGWTREQAALLRSGHLPEFDVEHLIEEIESIGRSERRQLTRRLEPLLMHLPKWEHRSERRAIDGNSWLRTIQEQHRKIPRLLRNNPSLHTLLGAGVRDAYEEARFGAGDATGLSLSVFPEDCPDTAEQILDQAFLPGWRCTGSAPAE